MYAPAQAEFMPDAGQDSGFAVLSADKTVSFSLPITEAGRADKTGRQLFLP